MPELPEVETTRRGIATLVTNKTLESFIVHEPRLRWPVPANLAELVNGKTIIACERRGKYLLLVFEHGTMLVHLGMSGSLRRVGLNEARRKHDHIEWRFDHARLLLHDPRRFGSVLWHDAADGPVDQHPRLVGLGVEPFSDNFNGAHLRKQFKGRQQAVKQALLAGNAVVGVGNIYASEALFRARINPKTAAGSLSLARCERLSAAIQETLNDALEAGGTTLRDYVSTQNEPGSYFDIHAAVYGREGQACPVCSRAIRRIVQGQRATYYCTRCQAR